MGKTGAHPNTEAQKGRCRVRPHDDAGHGDQDQRKEQRPRVNGNVGERPDAWAESGHMPERFDVAAL